MSLEIVAISNSGDKPDTECVYIKVKADCNLNQFILVDQTFREGQLSNTNRHFYRFPNKAVKAGDVIYVFTGKGKDSESRAQTIEKRIFTKYNFYCGSDACVWNNDGDVASIYKIELVGTARVAKSKK